MRAVLALLRLWAGPYPRELSAGRRGVIVFLSLAFFFGMLVYAGRKFQRALAARDQVENRPPDEVS